MHTPLLQKSHVFSQVVHGIEHHKLATILGIIAVLCLVYVLNIPVVHQMPIQRSPTGLASSSGIVRPLTLLDDPRYAHEYATRAQYINERLDRLRKEIRADRAYVFSYGYSSGRFGGMMELTISSIFEVGQEGLVHQIRDFQDLSRKNWLRVNRDSSSTGGFLPGPFPRSYGMELYNGRGVPIGYIGIEYWQEKFSLQGDKMSFLRQTAHLMKAGLLQPLENLESLEAQ